MGACGILATHGKLVSPIPPEAIGGKGIFFVYSTKNIQLSQECTRR